MKFLKLAYSKRSLESGEDELTLFESVRERQGFLLHSDGYTFIGYDPFARLWCHDGVTSYLRNGETVQIFDEDPLQVLRKLLRDFRFNCNLPVPFCGGLAGFFSYDFGAKLEDVQQKVFDDLQLPDFSLYFVDKVVAIDHQKSEIYFLSLAPTDVEAKRKVAAMENDFLKKDGLVHAGKVGAISSNLTREQYLQKLTKIKHHLEEGDTYQVNFSQRFTAESSQDPWQIYKRLAEQNPAPYTCYFDFDDFQIISSSPELLLKKKGMHIMTKPIKGTIARGKNAAEDVVNEKKLLASKKDAAELVMIVDLERNDLGKVCTAGSVHVATDREIEKYARVIHTVATVEGELAYGKDFFDLFKAMFPGGSITGCPKKRTMEIIDELEDFKRGVYTGSAGYIGFDGNASMNILIRTMLQKGGKIYYQAGGGIVVDSDCKHEYQESLQKAKSLRDALAS